MRYYEIITEGRDAPLYHGTGSSNAISIIEQDAIRAKTDHDTAKLTNYGSKGDYQSGVSLTRNKKMAEGFGEVVFEIDQRRLAQTNKLIPIDYWAKPDKPSNRGRGHSGSIVSGTYEYEEFCVGEIKPLRRYLIAIHMTAHGCRRLKRDYDMKDIAVLMKHPLLHVDGVLVNRSRPASRAK